MRLAKLQTFAAGSLTERVRHLPGVRAPNVHYYHDVVQHISDRDSRSAIREPLARSRAWQRRRKRCTQRGTFARRQGLGATTYPRPALAAAAVPEPDDLR